jgi:hypothetical protein
VITCSSCQRPNRSQRGFCGQCGAALQPVCRGCRFVNEGLDKFCGGCGSSIADRLQAVERYPAIVEPSQQLRPLSIIFEPAVAPATFATVVVSPDEGLPSAGITQTNLDRMIGVGS